MNDMKEAARESANHQVPAKQGTLGVVKGLLNNDEVKKRFTEILSEKAPQFMSSITSLVSSSTNFNDVDPNTIVASALVAATLNLPINQNFGFAYLIPYNSKTGKKCQFQMGYKGFMQLALRTGMYETFNATEVYEGELTERNRLTGIIKIDESQRKSNKVVGYAAYFKLISGFSKTLYMTVDEITAHAKKYSKSYTKEDGLWKKDFHAMAMKTVIKMILSKNGMLSVDYNMQKAAEADQAVVNEDGTFDYVDAKSEVDANFERELSPEDWENPTKIIEVLEAFKDLESFNSFVGDNSERLSSIGGKEGERIEKVIVEKLASFKK